MKVLEVIKLEKSYNGKKALDRVSFHVEEGEIVGYLGPNGAGKTTTLKIISGIIPKNGGKVKVMGKSLDEDPIAYKKEIGYVPETGDLYEYLTPLEFLKIMGELHDMDERILERRIHEMLEIFGLKDVMNTPMTDFSKGMKQKVVIIQAILHSPKLLLLDEPLNGLDASTALLVKKLLRELTDSGKSILFSSHIMEVVEKVCDRVIILNKGRIIEEVNVTELKDRLETLEDVFVTLTQERDYDSEVREIIKALEE